MAVKKIVKQITFQKKLIRKINSDIKEEIMDLVPEDRVTVKYVEGEEAELISGNALVETDLVEPMLGINKNTMSSGNPNNYDLSTVGSQELLDQLILNLNNKINE